MKNFQIWYDQGRLHLWNLKAVNTRDQGVLEKDLNMEHYNSKFCQENPKAGDINYGIKVHVND